MQVVGRNKLQTIVKEFCTQAGFSGYYTNHSGKVTCATILFKHNVDEQLIQRQTGHRSNAIRCYKCPSVDHDLFVSKVLGPRPSKTQARYSENNKENVPSTSNASSQIKGLIKGPIININFYNN